MSQLLKVGLAGTVAAIVAVVVTLFVGDAISGPLMVTSVGADVAEEVPIGGAIFGTVFGGIVGIALALLSKKLLGDNAVKAFVGICVVGLVAYGIFAFGAAEDTVTGVWLNVMHIAAAIPIVGALVQNLSTPDAA